MIEHPFILLKVPTQISRDNSIKWFRTVENNGPNNVISSVDIKPDNKQSKYYLKHRKDSYDYIISLSRDLETDEVKKIVDEWVKEYDGDFDIEWSQSPEINIKHETIKEDTLTVVVLEATKRAHNLWVNEKISEGWRYGTELNPITKTSPMCMVWENLSNKYKMTE